VGLIIIPEILPEMQKQLYAMILPSVSLLQIQKSAQIEKSIQIILTQLSTFAHFQYLAILCGEKQKTRFLTWSGHLYNI